MTTPDATNSTPNSTLVLTRAKEFASEQEQLRELVATFEESLSQELAIIQMGLLHREAIKVEHALHALKGFVPLFTNDAFAQKVAEVYQISRQNTLDVSEPAINSLVPTFNALLIEVRAWLSPL
jgi:HPt (histidine-containing phosphotransfer) domain-containing protein